MVEYFQGGGAEVIVCQGSALSYPWHSHVSTLTLGAVLEGVVELETDQGTGIYRENGLFALPPYMPHSLKAGSPYTLVSLCVYRLRLHRLKPGSFGGLWTGGCCGYFPEGSDSSGGKRQAAFTPTPK